MKLTKKQIEELLTTKWGEDSMGGCDSTKHLLHEKGLVRYSGPPNLTKAGKIVVRLLKRERALEKKVKKLEDDIEGLTGRKTNNRCVSLARVVR